MNNHCILFTGLSGAGKTTLSERLGKKLNYKVIHIDDLTRDLIRKKYPNKSLAEIEKKIGLEKMIELITNFQFEAFKIIFNKNKNKKVILEATVIMSEKSYSIIDSNPNNPIYLIKLLPEEVINKRRIERAIEKRKEKGKPPLTKEELNIKRKVVN